MGTFKQGDWGLKVLSLLVAILLWIYVSNENNPVKERIFKDIPVDVRGVSTGLAVSQLPGNVSIKVQANQNVISELSPDSIVVFTDLSGVKAGKREVNLEVQVPNDVKVLELTPERAVLNLEPLIEKQVPVKARTEGRLKKGYKILETRTRPDEVIVRGPKSIVDKVGFAVVDVHLKNHSNSFSETVPVTITAPSGADLDERLVKRVPSVVEISVPVVPDLPSKRVQVVPRLTGEPQKGFSVTMTVIDPPELIVSGKQDVIGQIQKVDTKPIDLTGKNKDLYVDVEPELPEGVFANRQIIRVLVRLEK